MNTQQSWKHSVILPDLARSRAHLRPIISLEVSPPRDVAGWRAVHALVQTCEHHKPDFLAMTDTGSARGEGAVKAAIQLHREFNVPVIAHMACAGRSRDDFMRDACRLAEAGIRHVLIVRGDPERGCATFRPHPDGFRYASEAIAMLRERHFSFVIGAACYPLGHPEDSKDHQDLVNMQRKQAMGTNFFVSQIVFDHEVEIYHRHALAAAKAGIHAPILPSCLVVRNSDRLKKIAARCRVNLGPELLRSLERQGNDRVLPEMAGLARGTLLQHAPGLHICTFNDPEATRLFLDALFG